MEKKIAFTLAEVLITLAIIGVVAALAIPSVVTNYRKKMYVTQLKKEYNYFTNAFRTAMARDGVTKLSDTKLYASMPSTGYPSSLTNTNYPEFKKEFLKIFNVVQIYDLNNRVPNQYDTYKKLNGDPNGRQMIEAVCLADGACLTFAFSKNPYTPWCNGHDCTSLEELRQVKNAPIIKLWRRAGQVTIDVNGFKKGPNQAGRDLFEFAIDDKGSLYPWFGIDTACGLAGNSYTSILTNTGNQYWRYNNNQYCNTSSNAYNSGMGCAARIMEEGWKMNY